MCHIRCHSIWNERWASSEEKDVNRFGSFRRIVYLCTRWWVINGCWLSVGCSLMQFIAECGIEYGCQFVTPFSFNSPRLPLDKERMRNLTELRKVSKYYLLSALKESKSFSSARLFSMNCCGNRNYLLSLQLTIITHVFHLYLAHFCKGRRKYRPK